MIQVRIRSVSVLSVRLVQLPIPRIAFDLKNSSIDCERTVRLARSIRVVGTPQIPRRWIKQRVLRLVWRRRWARVGKYRVSDRHAHNANEYCRHGSRGVLRIVLRSVINAPVPRQYTHCGHILGFGFWMSITKPSTRCVQHMQAPHVKTPRSRSRMPNLVQLGEWPLQSLNAAHCTSAQQPER